MSDGVLEALFELEKVTNLVPLPESSVAVTTWFAEEARPLREPTKEGALIEPLATRFPVPGLKSKAALVLRTVAVPPVAVLVNRTFEKPAAVVSRIVTPDVPPPPPPVNVPVTVRLGTVSVPPLPGM
jgi:hypothetical protein